MSCFSLTVGLKCGGSDAFQVLLQTRWLEHYPTLLFSMGSAILTEVPEMFGAETMSVKKYLIRW